MGVSLEPALLSFFTASYLSFPAFFILWDQVIFFFPILDLWSIFAALDLLLLWSLFNYFSKMCLFTLHRFCAAVEGEPRQKKPRSVSDGEWRSLRSQVSSQIKQGENQCSYHTADGLGIAHRILTFTDALISVRSPVGRRGRFPAVKEQACGWCSAEY